MEESPTPAPRPTESAPARDAQILADRVETLAIGFFVAGVLLLVIGVGLALFRGTGLVCLILGGVFFLAGCVEGVRAEVLRVRVKLEKD
jgi:hypothetical protein